MWNNVCLYTWSALFVGLINIVRIILMSRLTVCPFYYLFFMTEAPLNKTRFSKSIQKFDKYN